MKIDYCEFYHPNIMTKKHNLKTKKCYIKSNLCVMTTVNVLETSDTSNGGPS